MFENFDPFKIQPEIFSIAVVLTTLIIFIVIYYFKLKKIPVNQAPYGYVLLVQIYVEYIRNLVVDILGKKCEKLTPYFIFLLSYLCLCNLIGVLGVANPTSELTVTLTLGLVMFIGTFAIGFRYQKLSYLTRFTINYKSKKTKKSYGLMINPLELTSIISPLISISFRLWGNIFAGTVVMSLWYFVTQIIFLNAPYVGALNILGGITAPPLHLYFDFMSGIIQALVFTLLTMIYWTIAKEHGNYHVE